MRLGNCCERAMPDRPKTQFDDVPLGQPMTFAIERGHLEAGRTFSTDAVRALSSNMLEFILTQVSQRWERTGEPPSRLVVTVQCEVS